MSDNYSTLNERKIIRSKKYDNFESSSTEWRRKISDIPNTRQKFKKYEKNIIESFGLILYFVDYDNKSQNSVNNQTYKIYFLIQQRRETFEYFDFTLGLWTDKKQVKSMFSLMSIEERNRYKNYSFEDIWNDLWVNKNCRAYRENFAKAKEKYDSIKRYIPNILETTSTDINDPPWGFPKGRKNNFRESDYDCALRETEEETHIFRVSMSEPLRQIFKEEYVGTNGLKYSTIYYISEVYEKFIPDRISTPDCIRKTAVSEEVQSLEWVTYDDACKYVNPRRQLILAEVMKVLLNSSRKHPPESDLKKSAENENSQDWESYENKLFSGKKFDPLS